MSKGWRIAVIVILAAAVVAVIAAKSQKGKSETQSRTSPVASKPDTTGPATETPKVEPPAVKPSQETKPPVTTQAAKPVKPAATSPVSPVPKPPAHKRLPRFIDVGSEDCIPCKLMVPVMKQLREEYPGKLEVVFINKKKDPKAAEKLGVKLIPTQILYDEKGKEFFRHTGFYPKDEVVAKFKEHGVKL